MKQVCAILLALVMLTQMLPGSWAGEPTENTEVIESTQVPETTESSEATEPSTQETEPVETGEPVETTEPTEPAETTEPTEPVETTEPSEPVITTEPTEPTEPTDPTEPGREDEEHAPYIAGCGDGSFLPLAGLTRAELSQIMWRLGDYPDGEDRFSDVPASAWFARAVNALAASGILKGYSDGNFHPTDTTTRAMLVTVLQRLSGLSSENDCNFPDVSADHWARHSIALAQEQGWVKGFPDGTFGPDRPVTRAEAVTMINRFLGRTPDQEAIAAGEGLRFFPDVPPEAWYYEAVMEAATGHTAHYETPESPEKWLNPDPGTVTLPEGYYCFDKSLYVVLEGQFLRTEGYGELNGVSFHCSGERGVCTARTEVLELWDGSLALLSGGSPMAAPGAYTEGFYVKAGHLYAVENGNVVHHAKSGNLQGVAYSCVGESGRCTVSDWTRLRLTGIDLSIFEAALTPEAQDSGAEAATLAQAIQAAVRLYESYFRVEYPEENPDQAYYINKALEYGILTEARADYSAPVTRGEMAAFLYRGVMGRELEAINRIDAIPDLNASDSCYPYVLALYKAGVMKGTDEDGSASVNRSVSCTELAETTARLERRSLRLRFDLRVLTVESIRYGTSGSGKYPLTAWKLGSGRNVMVLTFAIHGWEDNWNKDGQELVYLADQTKAYLEAHQDLILDGNWTVYILRCLNPDGLNDGTTCDGPGRCTTKSYDSSGNLVSKGMDMNRCFPYNYVRMTSNRNYNGTAPLQCVEAKALANFIPGLKGSGYNIHIDTHGWLQQIITTAGAGTLYKAFAKQFPNSTYTYMTKGNGYFTGWTGRVLGFDSCLFEMPKTIKSHSDFLNAGCVWRFEAVIADLLQHYNGTGVSRVPLPTEGAELDGN